MSKIERGGKWVRPGFNFRASVHDVYTNEECQAQMLESIRNFLESCQMMQCDVAQAIKQMRDILKRIDRRMARKKAK